MKNKLLTLIKTNYLLSLVFFLLVGSCRDGTSSKTEITSDTIIFEYIHIKNKKDFAFPSIKTGNKTIDQKINMDMVNRHTDEDYTNIPTEEALTKWAEGMASVSYTVTYNQNDLISFFINSEACGSHCSSWTKYYTYSVASGEYLSIDKVIKLTDEFKFKVNQDREQRYQLELTQLEKVYHEHLEDLDSATYVEVLSAYKACKTDNIINDFLLYPEHLSLVEKCELPHAINNFGLSFSMDYEYPSIKEYLLQKNLN
jgi:hypothetical protein